MLLMMQRRKKYTNDPLKELRKQVRAEIVESYPSVDRFCLQQGFEKSTMSRFLNPKSGRTEYKIYTLDKLARRLGKRLIIRLE